MFDRRDEKQAINWMGAWYVGAGVVAIMVWLTRPLWRLSLKHQIRFIGAVGLAGFITSYLGSAFFRDLSEMLVYVFWWSVGAVLFQNLLAPLKRFRAWLVQ